MTHRAAAMCAAVACAAALAGCVVMTDEVVPISGASFDSRLLGAWAEVAGEDTARISRGDGDRYVIEYTANGETGVFEGHLGRLGGRLVLDLSPAPRDGEIPEPYASLLVDGHFLLDLDLRSDSLRAAALQPDSLLAALRTRRVRLGYGESRDRLIVQGTTGAVRSALGPYVRRAAAWGPPSRWRRVGEPITRPATAMVPALVNLPCFEAAAWPEADRIFHRDPHWVGADGASSVDLGRDRTLWLFGDTWIDPRGSGRRRGATMVSNTVAVQSGADPTTAAIKFYWGHAASGTPMALFADRGAERLWLGNGVRLDDRLVLFFNRTRRTNTGLGFESVGWTAVRVDNPDDEPSAWRVKPLATPPNPLGVIVGYAAVLRREGYVYAFGSEDPVKSHPLYAVRWPARSVHDGDLMRPEWWAGERLGWVPNSSSAPRWPLFENGSSDLTIHFDQPSRRFVVVQTVGFGPADIALRTAPALTGPWSGVRALYRPPEYGRPDVMIYSAKAHPQLAGGDLVLTYATNTLQFAQQLSDSSTYYPHLVRLTRCR